MVGLSSANRIPLSHDSSGLCHAGATLQRGEGGPTRIRTLISGFGDRYSTIELWALVRIENECRSAFIFSEGRATYRSSRYEPGGESILFLRLFVDLLAATPFAEFLQFDLALHKFLILARPIVRAPALLAGHLYQLILGHCALL